MFYVHILDNCKVPVLLDINLQCILAILFFKDGCFFQPGNIGICTDPCSVDERELFVCLDGLLDLGKEGVWPKADRGHRLCEFWRKFASCCFAISLVCFIWPDLALSSWLLFLVCFLFT